MYRVDSKFTVPVRPAPEAAETEPGYFSPGDPESETGGTKMPAWWCNTVQEELCAIVLAAGFELDKNDPAQVLAAIDKLIKEDPDISSAIASAVAAAASEASTARSMAVAAQGAADEAVGQAAESLDVSRAANIMAAGALLMAREADGLFTIDDTADDVDAVFTEVQRLYLTNPTVSGLPGDVDTPCWLEVCLNSEETSVMQRLWSLGGGSAYCRTGNVDLRDQENPAVAWGIWKSYGGGGVGFSAQMLITASGPIIAPVTGWCKVTLIGGGGGGGKGGGNDGGAGGDAGGPTIFNGLSARGGSGGGYAIGGGGGGGEAGQVVADYVFLTKGSSYPGTVGSGGAGGNTTVTDQDYLGQVGQGPYGGYGGVTRQGGGGAPGAGNGCTVAPVISTEWTGGCGGSGAVSGYDYGNGGGGGGGNGLNLTNARRYAYGGQAGPGAENGQRGGDNAGGGSGGSGGPGAIIIEYFDASA